MVLTKVVSCECVCESQREGPKAAPVSQYLRETDRGVEYAHRADAPAGFTCFRPTWLQVPSVINWDWRRSDSQRCHHVSTERGWDTDGVHVSKDALDLRRSV